MPALLNQVNAKIQKPNIDLLLKKSGEKSKSQAVQEIRVPVR